MLEFETIEEIEPNPLMLELLKDYDYEIKNGVSKAILKTNLEVIEPITYQITSPINLTILEYRVNEISNKPFYIKKQYKTQLCNMWRSNQNIDF